MSLQFDNKISLGHVISIVTMMATGIMAYASLSARQEQMVADIIAIKADASARESRIRQVEITQANQSGDLRAIQNSLTRIESRLEKLTGTP